MESWPSYLKHTIIFFGKFGPIPITDKNIPISAEDDTVRVTRNTADECFNYIVETIDKAILKLLLV